MRIFLRMGAAILLPSVLLVPQVLAGRDIYSYPLQIVPPAPWNYWLLIQDNSPVNFFLSYDNPQGPETKWWLEIHAGERGTITVPAGTVVTVVTRPQNNGAA